MGLRHVCNEPVKQLYIVLKYRVQVRTTALRVLLPNREEMGSRGSEEGNK